MDIGYAIVKGVVEGVTEFIPVSSTAHLIFMDAFARIFHWQAGAPNPVEDEFFDMLVQVGAIAAAAWYFRMDILAIWRRCRNQPVPEGYHNLFENIMPLRAVPVYMAVSPACTMALALIVLKGSKLVCHHFHLDAMYGINDLSDFFFHFPQLVAFHLIITGILIFFCQWVSDQKLAATHGQSESFTWHHAIAIGLFQGASAIFHGLSRSGSTISAGLATGLDRMAATRYSFMLSIPTFMVGIAYEALKLYKSGEVGSLNWPALIAGTVTAGIVGYFCIKKFIQFLADHRLTPFAVYCWVTGAAMFAFLSTHPG